MSAPVPILVIESVPLPLDEGNRVENNVRGHTLSLVGYDELSLGSARPD